MTEKAKDNNEYGERTSPALNAIGGFVGGALISATANYYLRKYGVEIDPLGVGAIGAVMSSLYTAYNLKEKLQNLRGKSPNKLEKETEQ